MNLSMGVAPGSKCRLTWWLIGLFIVLVARPNQLMGSAEKDPEEERAFYYRLRPRLGHFPEVEGYLKIYEEYFEHVAKLNDNQLTSIDINDWRHVRPPGEMCINFLQGFQVRRYKLNKPYDLIPLDACLGWLEDNSDEKQTDMDRFSEGAKAEAKKLAKDKKLTSLYSKTKFIGDHISAELKTEFHDYFSRLLKINSDNPKSGCHGLWLEAYQDFIEDVYLGECDEEDEECARFGGHEGLNDDAYVNLIVDSTKQASKNCYGVMQKQIKRIMHQAYQAEATATSLGKRIKSAMTSAGRQSAAMKWDSEMVRILQLVSDTDPDTPINLSQIVKDLNKIKNNEEESVEKFTEALARYAIKNVDLKDSTNDPEGRARFGRAMTKLCRPYINPKQFLAQTGGLWEDSNEDKKPFEFYSIVYGLIRITNHESLYDISKEKFEEDVIKNGWESLYLATFACQLISTTWGELDYDTNEEAFKVNFRSDEGEILIADWPIEVMMNKLVDNSSGFKESSASPGQQSTSGSEQEEPQQAQKQVKKEKPQAQTSKDKPQSKKGFKFSLFGSSHNHKNNEESVHNNAPNAPVSASAPVPVQAPVPEPQPAPIPAYSPVQAPSYSPAPASHSSARSYPPVPTPAPAPTQAPAYSPPAPSGQEKKHTMSAETLEMFRRIKGYTPLSLGGSKDEIGSSTRNLQTTQHVNSISYQAGPKPQRASFSTMNIGLDSSANKKPSRDLHQDFGLSRGPKRSAPSWGSVKAY